jgi:hypothetical protein
LALYKLGPSWLPANSAEPVISDYPFLWTTPPVAFPFTGNLEDKLSFPAGMSIGDDDPYATELTMHLAGLGCI